MRMTPSLKAFVVSEAARRKISIVGVIRLCVGFLERAVAERQRLEDLKRQWGWK
jgi:hypothetical protein